MKRGLFALCVAVALSGCVSTGASSIPALNGSPRVPVNKTVPDAVPYTVPTNTPTGE